MTDPHAYDAVLLGMCLVLPGVIVLIAFLATHSHRPNWSRNKHRWHFRH